MASSAKRCKGFGIKAHKEKGDALKYARLVHEALELPKSVETYDVIQFMVTSRNEIVGKGAGERLAPGSNVMMYKEFKKLDGRSVLSNMYPSSISIDGMAFPSVEHAFHAGKALLAGDSQAATRFTVEGQYGHMFPKEIKKYGGKKSIRMSADAISKWNGGASYDWMERCIRARYLADALFRTVLRGTRDAILVHQVRGQVDVRLSQILHKLRGEIL